MTIREETQEDSRESLVRHLKIPFWRIFVERYGVLVAWALLIAIYGALLGDTFLSVSNFRTIFNGQAILLILTLGLVPALAAGEYDLSAASVLGISLVLVGYLNVLLEWPIGWTVVIAICSGIVIGSINALLIVAAGIDSIVVTLGMSTLLAGVAIGINNLSVAGISRLLVAVSRTKFLGFQMVFYYALALVIILWYVFAYTPLGRYIYFVGAGREVARLTGIKVNLIRAGTLIAASTIAAIDGVLLAGLLGSADPTIGPKFLLPAFASAFLGMTTITPGRFNPWGAFIAVYFLLTGITGLELMGLTGWVEQVFYGASLIVAVLFSRIVGERANGTR